MTSCKIFPSFTFDLWPPTAVEYYTDKTIQTLLKVHFPHFPPVGDMEGMFNIKLYDSAVIRSKNWYLDIRGGICQKHPINVTLWEQGGHVSCGAGGALQDGAFLYIRLKLRPGSESKPHTHLAAQHVRHIPLSSQRLGGGGGGICIKWKGGEGGWICSVLPHQIPLRPEGVERRPGQQEDPAPAAASPKPAGSTRLSQRTAAASCSSEETQAALGWTEVCVFSSVIAWSVPLIVLPRRPTAENIWERSGRGERTWRGAWKEKKKSRRWGLTGLTTVSSFHLRLVTEGLM